MGRKLPSEKEPTPPLYKMQIFASNHVIAKSRFWYLISMLRRVKKGQGEIVSCEEVSFLDYLPEYRVQEIEQLSYQYAFRIKVFRNRFSFSNS